MLKFKVDENLPIEVAEMLARDGHDALTVPDQSLGGAGDFVVSTVCRDEGRAVVTLDLDFADIRLHPPQEYAGIVVLRLARLSKPLILNAVKRLLPVLSQEPLTSKLWIVDETRIRIRS